MKLSFKSSTLLKSVIGFKIVLLLGIWVSMDPRWTVGDKNAVAQEESLVGSKAKSQRNEGSKKEVSQTKPAERKSFLSNLLDLPTLDTESLKKDELGKYLDLAEKKKRQVEERISLLNAREVQLKSLEGSIEKKLRLLEDERKFFAQSIQKEKEIKGTRLDKLITFYQKMEPKKAAPMLEEMDKDLVVSLFKNMPQKQITAILEKMTPAKSVELSEYFGRVRSAREYELLKEMNKSLVDEFDECKGMKETPAE